MSWIVLQAPVPSAEPEKSVDLAAETKQPVKIGKPTKGVATADVEKDQTKTKPKKQV